MQANNEEVILKVSKSSPAKALGSAIARELDKHDHITCRAIGVQAVNQCVKAIAIAGGFVGQKGCSVVVRIGFHNVFVHNNDSLDPDEDKTVTAINFTCSITS